MLVVKNNTPSIQLIDKTSIAPGDTKELKTIKTLEELKKVYGADILTRFSVPKVEEEKPKKEEEKPKKEDKKDKKDKKENKKEQNEEDEFFS